MPWRNLKYSTDWHLLTRQNSYASKQKRHNAKDTNQFIFGLDHGGIKISWWRIDDFLYYMQKVISLQTFWVILHSISGKLESSYFFPLFLSQNLLCRSLCMTFTLSVFTVILVRNLNQRLSIACIVHLVIKRTNWSYVKTMSCSGSHLGITINIKNMKFVKDLPMIDAQFN